MGTVAIVIACLLKYFLNIGQKLDSLTCVFEFLDFDFKEEACNSNYIIIADKISWFDIRHILLPNVRLKGPFICAKIELLWIHCLSERINTTWLIFTVAVVYPCSK